MSFTRIGSAIACTFANLEDAISEFIQESAEVEIENSGIGAYECWGYNGVDRGTDRAVVSGDSVCVRLGLDSTLACVDADSASDLKPAHFLDGFSVSGSHGVTDESDGLEWIVNVAVKSIAVVGQNIELSVEWSQN